MRWNDRMQMKPVPVSAWHGDTPEAVTSSLQVDATTGLTATEAAARLIQYGPNQLDSKPPRPAWLKFLDQFRNLLVIVLIGAAALAGLVGDLKDALVIVTVVLFNAALGFFQEHRAEAALAALKNMLAPSARVRRDHTELLIPAIELVPGDLLLLEAGDRIPADVRVLHAHSAEVAQAALTGESHPVAKSPHAVPLATPLAERHSMAYMNTVVTRGRIDAVVIATGMQTEMGKLAGMLAEAVESATPLQIQLDQLGKRLAAIAGAVVALIFAIGLQRGDDLVQTAMTAIALAVAAIPEGLPAVVTVTLALGMHRMAKRHAIVKKLAAVETLGCTTVICSDKTGTLTLNQMTARRIFAMGRSFAVSGEGYRGVGQITTEDGQPVPDLSALRAPATLCADARIRGGELIGDPTEGALRVLALAGRSIPAADFDPAGDLMPWVERLTLLGLVGLIDPPRPEAREAIRQCHAAGIDVKMITGDHGVTAAAIARDLGLPGEVHEGREIEGLQGAALADLVARTGVFARVSPEHKLRIVAALKARGHVVAMTGDGVNDAPALKTADIGIAMGITGTEVTQEAATLVLADDNFASIVGAVQEGRTIYDNIVKFVRFQLSTNIGAILTVLGAPMLGMPMPFTAIQILWVNIIMDGPPAMTLGVEPAQPGIMEARPRSPKAGILTGKRLIKLLFYGVTMAAGTLATYAWGQHTVGSAYAMTLAFTTFVLFQFFNIFNARSEVGSAFNRQFFSNGKLWLSLTAVLVLQALVVHWAPAQAVFDTVDLSLADWLLSASVAASVLLLEESRKLLLRLISRP